jgi:hypothetical protein
MLKRSSSVRGALPASNRRQHLSARMIFRASIACAAIAAGIGVLACSDKNPTGIPVVAPLRSELLASVTGAAAMAVDASGRFQLAAPVAGRYPEITAADANGLAATWAREYGPLHLRFLQETHGGTINFHTLAICGRTFYVRNAFVPPSADIPSPYLKPYGPWWLVTMCAPGDVPTVSVAVSAWATELSISNGKIKFPFVSGNEFFGIGIPLGQVGEFPGSPEAAATLVAKQSGRRVVQVPELIMAANTDGPPQAARWHLTLDSPANFHSARSGNLAVNEVFVGSPKVTELGVAVFVASPVQPSAVGFRWTPLPQPNESWKSYQQRVSASVTIESVKRRSDTPARFEPATIAAGGQ